MLELNKIYCGDNLSLIKQLDNESIDLSVQSPPYDNLRNYNGFSWNFEELCKELFRVTKNGGICVWVIGDQTKDGSETGTSFKQALYFKEIGWNLHDTMIYAKTNTPPKTHKRYEQSFEYMFIFCKGKINTFNPILEPCKYAGKVSSGTMRRGSHTDELSNKQGNGKPIKDNKIKSNIWYYRIGKAEDDFANKHPAIFPSELVEDHIISWSNPNDLVLDIFNGSGTTTKIAKKLGRNFIGFDISEEYCEIARQRLNLI